MILPLGDVIMLCLANKIEREKFGFDLLKSNSAGAA